MNKKQAAAEELWTAAGILCRGLRKIVEVLDPDGEALEGEQQPPPDPDPVFAVPRLENHMLRKHLRWAVEYAHRGGAEYCCADIDREHVAMHPSAKDAAHRPDCPYRLAREALDDETTRKEEKCTGKK